MKGFITFVLIAGVVLLATMGPANAQVPHLQIYFDPYQLQTTGYCQGVGAVDTIYVTAINLDMWLKSIEFSIEYPSASMFVWVGDVHTSPLYLGSSPTGVTITWPTPRDAFSPFIVMRAVVVWQCSGCPFGPFELMWVRPHPGTGKIQAVRWPDYEALELYGFDSPLCSYLATEETTWGRIKALYQ